MRLSRPTSVLRQPNAIKKVLSRDQFRLYQLIWQRFVASQMMPAIYKTLSVEVIGEGEEHKYLLRASGSQLEYTGFLAVYEEGRDEDKTEDEEENSDRIPIDDIYGKPAPELKNFILNSTSHTAARLHVGLRCRSWKRTVSEDLQPSANPFDLPAAAMWSGTATTGATETGSWSTTWWWNISRASSMWF